MATLQRLGEDVETSLKQLLFGTVRRSLRVQITEEMNRHGYLGSYEWKILDRISLIEVHKPLVFLSYNHICHDFKYHIDDFLIDLTNSCYMFKLFLE